MSFNAGATVQNSGTGIVNASGQHLIFGNEEWIEVQALFNQLRVTNMFREADVIPLVEANTAGSGAPNVLAASESGATLTNEGATAQNYHTLPSAVAGLEFTFIVQDSDGIRVTAASGDTIRLGASVSAAAGRIESTTIGDSVTLKAINATEWVATSIVGAGWSVT